MNNGAAGTLEGATLSAAATPKEMNFACALKSNGLMRYVANLSRCKDSERKITIKPGPHRLCVKADGSVRRVSSFSECKPSHTRLTLPPTSGTTHFCADEDTGLLRKVSGPSRCTSDEFPVFVTPNDAAPSVSSTLPVNGANNIALDRNITISFNESVSATTSSFTLVCGGASKTFTLSGSPGSSLTLDPTADLPEGTSCTVTALANQITDADTVDPPDNMSANHTFSFTTDSAPTVTSTSPADGATGVDPSGDLTVNFSEPVNASTSSFTLECPSGTTESFSVSGSGTDSITLNPDADLPGATVCKIAVLTAGISDVDGGDPPDNLAANHVSTFTTADAAPSVTSTTPDGAVDHIAVDTNVTVDFSEPVNASTSSFTLECPSGSGVNFTVDGSGTNSITLDPDSDLPEGTSCDVQVIADQISDTDGVDPPDNMAANHNFSFTTDSAPAFTGSTPSDGASDVEPSANITVDFDEPVDVDASSFTLLCEGNAQTFSVSGSGTNSITLDPGSDLPSTSNCTVTAVAANISDTDSGDPPDNMAANESFSFTTQDAAPSVDNTSPTDGATDMARDTNIDITFSEPVSATASSFALECPSGTSKTFTISGSPGSTITLTPEANLPAAETCTVKVIADQISDTDTVDPPDNMADDYTFSFSVVANLAPTDIALDNSSVDENQPSGTTVGTLSSTDPDAGDTFTYDFATGTGDTDNTSFTIDNDTDTLKTNDTFDFETKATYSILVKTTDSGGLSFEKQFTISVNNVNDAPTDISLSPDSIDENKPSGTTIGTLSATDDDSGQTHDFTLENSGCNGSFPDNDSFSISGTDLQSAASFDFEDKNSYTICVRTTDSGSPAQSFDKQLTITINDVNDPPVVTTSAGSNTFTEDGPPVTVDDSLTVEDADSPDLTGATVSITSNFASSQDELPFTDTAEIKGSYDPTTGVLTLSGTATKAQYESALRSVTYSNTSQNPSGDARTISFEVDDGSASSDAATKSVNVTPVNDAPALTQPDGDLSYTEDTPSENHQLAIAPNLSVSDVDSTTIQSATVQITGNYQNGQDVLSFAAANGISGSFDASSGKLTLTHTSGTKTLAEYEAALRAVKYSNTSENPSADKRTVTFQADDGGSQNNLSNTPTRDITVTPTNDNPLAADESFNGTSRAIGNTSLVVNDPTDGAPDPNGPQKTVSGDILSNDTDVDGPGPLAVQAVTNKATTDGGSVNIEVDGDFTFHPKAGTSCTDHTDSFDYTLTDGNTPTAGTDTGTVTIDIQDCVWYVDSSLGTNGDGRSHSPFNSLSGINGAGGTGDPDDANQKLFLYDGTYSGGLPLENGQTLFSQRHGLVVPDGGSGNVTLEAAVPPGPNTTITGGLTLASGNTIQGIHLGNATGVALSGSSVGNATMNTQTSGAIDNQTGAAMSINGGTLNMAFTGVSSSGGTNNVLLSGVGTSGTLALGSGSLSGASSDAFKVSGGNGSFSYSGSISNANTLAANIENKTGGTVTLSGDINPTSANKGISVSGNTGGATVNFSGANKKISTGTSTGVNLSNNGSSGGATINFTNGGLDIDTTSGAGFSATGGGTVTVQGSGNTIDAVSAPGLTVANTTIGSSNLTFQRISSGNATAAADPANGIVLNNTGTAASNGGLVVTGTGGTCTAATPTCTGGTIQTLVGGDDSSFTPVGTGIVLTSTRGPSLTSMRVRNASNYGIRGNQVTNLSLANSLVDGTNGTNEASPFSDGSISFDTILGTNSITGSEISGGWQRNIRVDHAAGVGGGTMTLTITGNNIHDTVGTAPDDGVFVEAENNDNYTVNVANNTLKNHGGDHVNVTMINNATINVSITGNTLENPETPVRLGGGIFVFGASWNGTGTYTVSNNTILRNRQGGAIHMNKGSGTGTLSGSVTNNTIGTSGVNKSGSIEASGIVIGARGASGTHTTLVEDNNIFGWNDRAIILENGEGSPTLNATVRGNTADTFDPVNGLHGLHADLGILSGDAGSVCLDVGGALTADRNHLTLAGNEAQGGADIRVRRASAVNLRMPGYAGGSDDDAAVTSYLSGRNDVTSLLVSSPGTGTYSGGGACPQP